jgi:hypothetical protein
MPGMTPAELRRARDAMAALLTTYEHWLTFTLAGEETTSSGTDLMALIRELQREWFADATGAMGQLLLVQTDIVSLVFEQKMSALRGVSGSGSRVPDLLLSRQLEALQAMRAICGCETTIQTQAPLPVEKLSSAQGGGDGPSATGPA